MLNNEGTYRAKGIQNLTVQKSSGGFPQAILELVAEEMYDDDEKVWVPMDQLEGAEGDIMAWLVLFGGNGKETRNSEQVRKVTGWDGSSFAALDALDVSEAGILFRCANEEYNEKVSMRVQWIDDYNANPAGGGSVAPLDKAAMTALDAEYKSLLKPKTVKPASAPTAAAPPTQKKKTIKQQRAADKAARIAKNEAADAAASVLDPATDAPHPDGPEATPKSSGPPSRKPAAASTAAAGSCTQEQAWDKCIATKAADVTEDTMTEVWLAKLIEITGETPEDQITPEQWFAVAQAVLDTEGMSAI